MSKKKKEEHEDDWVNDPEIQEFLEWADQPGPWPEEHDKIYTIGGLSADKDGDFMKFQKKMRDREDFEGPNHGKGV